MAVPDSCRATNRQTSATAPARNIRRVELFAVFRIPIFVQGPNLATQTCRPSPLMAATGTQPARIESVPYRAAAAEEIFRMPAIAASPCAPRLRPPPARRAANTALVRVFVISPINGIGRVRRRKTLLEKGEDSRDRPVSTVRSLFHRSYRLYGSYRIIQPIRPIHNGALENIFQR